MIDRPKILNLIPSILDVINQGVWDEEYTQNDLPRAKKILERLKDEVSKIDCAIWTAEDFNQIDQIDHCLSTVDEAFTWLK